MKTVHVGVFLLLVVAIVSWLFRYDYLPPVVQAVMAAHESPRGWRTVVCKADRWTRDVSCDSVIVEADRAYR